MLEQEFQSESLFFSKNNDVFTPNHRETPETDVIFSGLSA
jgi:hypothetical protein